MSESITTELRRLSACDEAVEWARQFRSDRQKAWEECERADWMMWYLEKKVESGQFDRKRLVLVLCESIRPEMKLIPENETCPMAAIETAEAWARGEGGVTLADVERASSACSAASSACSAHYAYSAAYAHTAAYYVAASAIHYAASAHTASAAVAYTVAWIPVAHTARKAIASAHKKMCRIIRREIPKINVVRKQREGRES